MFLAILHSSMAYMYLSCIHKSPIHKVIQQHRYCTAQRCMVYYFY